MSLAIESEHYMKKKVMPKIAVIYLGRKGAGPVYALEMTKGLIANGAKVYAFISTSVENLESWLEVKTVKTELIKTADSILGFIPATIRFRMINYRLLKKRYRKVIFDACYYPMDHAWDDYLCNIVGRPQKIYTLHDPIKHSSDLSLKNKIIGLGINGLNIGICKKKPDDIIILSNTFKEYVEEAYKMKSEHVHVIPHGIFDFYEEMDDGSAYPYDVTKINFLFWGRICGYKGLDTLAHAYKKLKERNADIALTVVGSGDFSKFQSLYESLEDVKIVNEWIPDEKVASYFKCKSRLILVLPYKDATQSGVIPTAMNFKVPVIASNVGGLSEQIENEVTGFLCEPNKPEALAECMEKVMNIDTGMIQERAYLYIKSLDWNRLSEKVLDIIYEDESEHT